MTKKPTTIIMPIDVRDILRAGTEHNLTSMAAEIARSVRERAQREREAAAS